MLCVLSATRTVLIELQPVRIVTAILLGGVVPLLAVIALKRDHGADIFLLGSHSFLPTVVFQLFSSRRPQNEPARRSDQNLFEDLGDDAGTNGQATFTDGKL